MKTRILFLLLFTLPALTACKDSGMQAGAEWLNEPDLEAIQGDQSFDIASTDIYEATASKAEIALMELEEKSIIKLSPELAKWYIGHTYTCPTGKQAYLIRAVYGHAGTGTFSLKRIEDDLVVKHQSLGRSTIYQKTALVVNLDYEPDQIFIRVSIAE